MLQSNFSGVNVIHIIIFINLCEGGQVPKEILSKKLKVYKESCEKDSRRKLLAQKSCPTLLLLQNFLTEQVAI